MLFSGLGVKLIVVTGIQTQIDALLSERGMSARYMNGYRITDHETMRIVTEAVGEVRTQVERCLSKVSREQHG